LVSEIIGASAEAPKSSGASSTVNDFYEEANQRTTTASDDYEEAAPAPAKKAAKSAPSLDDLYNDL